MSVEVVGSDRPVGMDVAMELIDGDPHLVSVISGAGREVTVEMVFVLPATTRFERFAVPWVSETPSPGQTFFETVEIQGSAAGPEGPWAPLGAAVLTTHEAAGLQTEIPATESAGVRWVKLRLSGGIDIGRDLMSYEFSELIGNGEQEAVALADDFRGVWKERGVLIELAQAGAVVTGCVDREGQPFDGTVSGNILRGRAVDQKTGVESLFVLTVAESGMIRGVRSTNGAPFRLYTGPPAPEGTTTECSPRPPTLGCGSVIHGINFGVDSAAIRPDSASILLQLFSGLEADPQAAIRVAGHTSSEGSVEHNQDLSERRAQSVVDDLVRRGIAAERIRAVGFGESSPIASNDTESGRALNRRVEIHCDEG